MVRVIQERELIEPLDRELVRGSVSNVLLELQMEVVDAQHQASGYRDLARARVDLVEQADVVRVRLRYRSIDPISSC